MDFIPRGNSLITCDLENPFKNQSFLEKSNRQVKGETNRWSSEEKSIFSTSLVISVSTTRFFVNIHDNET